MTLRAAATLLAQTVLSGRVTLDTPVAQRLPDFKIPSRGGKEITRSAPSRMTLRVTEAGMPKKLS